MTTLSRLTFSIFLAAGGATAQGADNTVHLNAGATSLEGSGLSTGKKEKDTTANAASGSSTGGAASTTTTPGDQVLSVVCSPKMNVLTWKLVAKRNSNSLLRSVDGASNAWVCGGPNRLAPCKDLEVNAYVDNDVVEGKIYKYVHKSAPGCASNIVTCPSGVSTGVSCVTGGIAPPPSPAPGGGSSPTPAPGGGGTTGGGGTGGGADLNCTGGNPQCICVKNSGAYNQYENEAHAATQAAFPGADEVPQGMSAEEATAKICAAYNANKTMGANSACRAQADEIVFEDPGAPNPRYPTISVDVITSQGKFWRNSIAACELGVQ